MNEPPAIADAAHRHGVVDGDILHAMRMATDWFDLDDNLAMIIGPARDSSLLEIGYRTDTDTVIHAMTARPKFLR